jgi:hypothetical protein
LSRRNANCAISIIPFASDLLAKVPEQLKLSQPASQLGNFVVGLTYNSTMQFPNLPSLVTKRFLIFDTMYSWAPKAELVNKRLIKKQLILFFMLHLQSYKERSVTH